MSNLAVTMTGDEVALWRALSKIVSKNKDVESGFKKVGDEAKKTEQKVDQLAKKVEKIKPPPVPPPVQLKAVNEELKRTVVSGEQAFGSMALGKVGSFAAGFLAVGTAVQGVNAVIQLMKQETDAAVQSIERLTAARKGLAGRAESGQDYAQMKKQAESLSKQFGLDQESAYNLVSDARAGGFEGSLKPIALASATFADAGDLTKTASVLPTLFEGVNAEEAVNLVAATDSAAKTLDYKQASDLMQVAAQGGKQAGASASETAALVAVGSDLFGQSTGDRIKAFGGRVALDKNLSGKGIMGAFDALRAMPEGKRRKFLGESQELNAVYAFLEERGDDVRAVEGELSSAMAASGTDQSPIARRAKAFLDDPENAALFSANVQKQRAEIAGQKERGITGLNAQQAKDAMRARWRKDGTWYVNRAIGEAGMFMADAVSDDPHWIRGGGITGSRGMSPAGWSSLGDDMNWNKAQNQASEKMVEAALKIDQAAENLKQSTSPPRTNAQRAELNRQREN